MTAKGLEYFSLFDLISYQIKHQEIDEWGNYEHEKLDYFDPGNDYGHYCIDQEAEEQHNLIIQEDYESTVYVENEAQKEHSILEQGEGYEEDDYRYSKDEVYEAIEGNKCFSPSNPFLQLFLD
jgi:hypothetical protein